ncbi:hypothetical protein [Methanospirillum purgamenti]|nr:hypothetical protein [Methanospirillum hungatei]
MAMKCSICHHPEREAIDKAILAGQSNRSIAAQYKVSQTAVQRHKDNHLPEHLATSKKAEQVTKADDLISDLQFLKEKALTFLAKAEQSEDMRSAAPLISAAVKVIETLAEVRGELNRQAVINVTMSPVWVETRTVILAALQPYPEAREAVVLALEDTCRR